MSRDRFEKAGHEKSEDTRSVGAAWSRSGRFVAVVAPTALVVMTAAWLFLGSTRLREFVVLFCLVCLGVCVLAVGTAAVRAGSLSRAKSYEFAAQAASVTRGHVQGAAPSRLAGGRHKAIRSAAVLVSVPALLALWIALGVADPHYPEKNAALVEAGVTIEQRPIVTVENEEVQGHGRRSGATAEYGVLLPAAGGGKPSVPATFTADVYRRHSVGSDLFVAYAPDRPELGAVGDDQRPEVERLLAGRAVEAATAWTIAAFGLLVTLALLIGWWVQSRTRRPSRSVDSGWVAFRVTLTGAGKHVDSPPAEGTGPAAERKRRENTRQLPCLFLGVEGSEYRLPFHSQMSTQHAAAALSGARGWLLWHPDQRRSKDVLAEFVGDDGWQLPGAVPTQAADQAAHDIPNKSAHPDPERRVELLDFGAGWATTVSKPVLAGLMIALGCMSVLLLAHDNGAWRAWVAAAGFLAPAIAAATSRRRADPAR
ncbi:hypothetical protein [Streptomyces sp. NPDC048639]|uniref:hypothetical protein n=1 Tax=Streptomyces sp. NPDC048639 TaxID=3365581 RepID=UPI00371BEB02